LVPALIELRHLLPKADPIGNVVVDHGEDWLTVRRANVIVAVAFSPGLVPTTGTIEASWQPVQVLPGGLLFNAPGATILTARPTTLKVHDS